MLLYDSCCVCSRSRPDIPLLMSGSPTEIYRVFKPCLDSLSSSVIGDVSNTLPANQAGDKRGRAWELLANREATAGENKAAAENKCQLWSL